MSASSHELTRLRVELDGVNRQLLGLVQARRSLVSQIQTHKRPHDRAFECYDSEREWSLLQTLKPQLEQLSPKELLAFSLLMEEQAGAPARYPEWSAAVHLTGGPDAIEHRLNPLLVKLLWPPKFAGLNLSTHFSFLRSI